MLRQVNFSALPSHAHTKDIPLTFVVPIATQSTGQQSYYKTARNVKKMLSFNAYKTICEHKSHLLLVSYELEPN